MKLNTAYEDALKFNITIPKLSYKRNKNENLTVHFEMIYRCVHEENTFYCSSKCLKDSKPVIHKIISPSNSFVHTFYELTPNWQYKFRAQVLKPMFFERYVG